VCVRAFSYVQTYAYTIFIRLQIHDIHIHTFTDTRYSYVYKHTHTRYSYVCTYTRHTFMCIAIQSSYDREIARKQQCVHDTNNQRCVVVSEKKIQGPEVRGTRCSIGWASVCERERVCVRKKEKKRQTFGHGNSGVGLGRHYAKAFTSGICATNSLISGQGPGTGLRKLRRWAHDVYIYVYVCTCMNVYAYSNTYTQTSECV
jgi:hypothetical protein